MKAMSSDPSYPVWTPGFIDQYILEDETDLVQYGQSEELTFEKVRVENSQASDMNKWPTKENPTNGYKFNSLWLELGQEYLMIER